MTPGQGSGVAVGRSPPPPLRNPTPPGVFALCVDSLHSPRGWCCNQATFGPIVPSPTVVLGLSVPSVVFCRLNLYQMS